MDISICILRDILSNQVLSRINLPPELRVSEVEDKQDLVEGDVGEGVRGDGGGGLSAIVSVVEETIRNY